MTVRCPFWAGGVVDPFFFEDDEGLPSLLIIYYSTIFTIYIHSGTNIKIPAHKTTFFKPSCIITAFIFNSLPKAVNKLKRITRSLWKGDQEITVDNNTLYSVKDY